MLHLARRAFAPGRIPFPIMHVDTGHNFDELMEFRDRTVAEFGVELIVASVQESIDAGRVRDVSGPRSSRNQLQTVTLLDAIAQHGFDAVFGGGRRDEERARAKERIYSHRDEFGQWDPKNQRPELWSLYNSRHHRGEHLRIFPLSNWTELDIWEFIRSREVPLPSLYFAHRRQVFSRDSMLMAVNEHVEMLDGEEPFEATVRFRTIGDTTCTAAVESAAFTIDDIVAETSVARITERGRPAPTTACPRPAWKTASARGTSDAGTSDASSRRCVRHGRQCRRRQVDAHRPTAARLEVDLRGPTRTRRGREQEAWQRLRRPCVADRRPAGGARAGHHHRRGVPVLLDAAPQLHHRRLPRAHPVHPQHGDRRLDGRPRHGADRRPPRRGRADAAATACWCRSSACRTS